MNFNTLGIVLCHYREKNSYSLEKVCSGLCSVSTLSRIERGDRIADSLLGGLLLERIGREVTQFELILNEEDYELWCARDRIRKAVQEKEYVAAYREIVHYHTMKKTSPKLHEQFCLFYEAIIHMSAFQEGSISKAERKLEQQNLYKMVFEALKLTRPKFYKEKEKGNQLYTKTEIKLILLLLHYGYKNFTEDTEQELRKLLEYVERIYTERKKEDIGIPIIMELIEWAQRTGDDKKVIIYVDKGIEFISQGRKIKGLEKLHFLKARTLMNQYDTGQENGKEKRKIQKECLMAYSICEVMGQEKEKQEIEVFCKEKLKWQITGLVISSD